MTTADVVPNGDGATIDWSSSDTTHSTEIDEAKASPDCNDYINAVGASKANKIDIINMSSIANVDEVTQIVVWVYWWSIGSVALEMDINLGGWQSEKNIAAGGAGWDSLTWGSLSGSQADLNGLQVKFDAGSLTDGTGCIPVSDQHHVCTMYAVVTYTEAAGGWGHKFIGVAGADIAKVSGVLIANIADIKGVDI